jgi:ribonuclease P protein component
VSFDAINKASALSSTKKRFLSHWRLSSPKAFQNVFRAACGKSAKGGVTVLAVRNGLSYARLGLAIAKKKLPAAPARNRLKRIIRESFRFHHEQLAGLDIVVLNTTNAGTKTNTEIFTALIAHWKVVAEQCKTSLS